MKQPGSVAWRRSADGGAAVRSLTSSGIGVEGLTGVLADDPEVLVEDQSSTSSSTADSATAAIRESIAGRRWLSWVVAASSPLDRHSAKRLLVAEWQPVEGHERGRDEGLVLLPGAGAVQHLEDDRRTCNDLTGLVALGKLCGDVGSATGLAQPQIDESARKRGTSSSNKERAASEQAPRERRGRAFPPGSASLPYAKPPADLSREAPG
jgi:hypothetical protein